MQKKKATSALFRGSLFNLLIQFLLRAEATDFLW